MSKQFSGVSKIYITEHNSSTGDIVLLDRLSTDTTITQETIEVESTTSVKYGGQTWTLEATSFKSDDDATINTLRDWSENDRRVIMAIELIDGVILWNEPANLGSATFQFAVNARDGLNKIYMKTMSLGGYPNIVYAKNIVKAIAKYTSSKKPKVGVYTPAAQYEGEADVWTDKGTKILDSGVAVSSRLNVFYPMVGEKLTFSAVVKDSATPLSFSLDSTDFSGSSLALSELVLDGTGGKIGERHSNEITISTGAYYLNVYALNGETDSIDNISIRKDGRTNFIDY